MDRMMPANIKVDQTPKAIVPNVNNYIRDNYYQYARSCRADLMTVFHRCMTLHCLFP